jgi:hypothetical protein
VYTPAISVPPAFDYYITDQSPLVTTKGKGIDRGPAGERVPMQIHQWFHDAGGTGQIADWVIAERLLFARGETIGRDEVNVEVPVWSEGRDDFRLGNTETVKQKVGGKIVYKTVSRPLVALKFGPEENAPVIADFEGGKGNYKLAQAGTIQDEGSQEVLILTPEGKLIVRNSRDDSDEEAATGRERHQRYEAWKTRLEQVRRGGTATTPPMGGTDAGNPGMP